MSAQLTGHRARKPKLRWALPDGWRKSKLVRGEIGTWVTRSGENTVVVKKEGGSFVVESSDYMGEYTHRVEYIDAQTAFDGAYEEMWGRSPEWYRVTELE
jgi:hypothetical protein